MQVYGQPIGPEGYDVLEDPTFICWMPVLKVVGEYVRHPFERGYKVHVSVDPGDAERVAQHLLPAVQRLRLDHKVVHPVSTYVRMNGGEQKGKFVTLYPGPVLEGFTALVGALDPLLLEINAKPGPQPMERLSGHAIPEKAVGSSGLLYYVTVASYRD